MARVESSRPPGVSSERTTRDAWRAAASARPRWRYWAEMGWMVSRRVRVRMRGDWALEGGVKSSARSRERMVRESL
jgi:hypothetical protein